MGGWLRRMGEGRNAGLLEGGRLTMEEWREVREKGDLKRKHHLF